MTLKITVHLERHHIAKDIDTKFQLSSSLCKLLQAQEEEIYMYMFITGLGSQGSLVQIFDSWKSEKWICRTSRGYKIDSLSKTEYHWRNSEQTEATCNY